MMQNRQQPSSAARWNSRTASGPQLPTAKDSLLGGAGVIEELETMAKKLKMSDPAYRFAGGTSSGRGYFCSVHIGAHHAGSVDEYVTQEQAKNAAAFNAVNVLKTYYGDKLNALQHSNGLPASSKAGNNSQNAAADVDSEKENDPGTNSGDDFERVVENLLDLLASMPRGIYSHALSHKYLENYKQNLPSDWLPRIKEGYPEFVVDEVDAFRSIISKRRAKGPIPPRKEPGAIRDTSAAIPAASSPNAGASMAAAGDENRSEAPKEMSALSPPPESPKKEESKEMAPDQVVPLAGKVRFNDNVQEKEFSRMPGEEYHEIIYPPPIAHPPPFILPDGESNWNVFVSVVKTPADFVVRLIGEEYSEQYEQLQRDMQTFYEMEEKGEKLSVSSMLDSLIGNVYAARAEECWHRVYLHDIIPADEGIAEDGIMASVYFIDHGDYETIPLDDLRKLEQYFMRLPCQAVAASLSGFEYLSLEDFTQDMIDRFRDITLAKILPAKYLKNLEVAASMGDGVSVSTGPVVLKMAMPLESEPQSGEAAENESEATPGAAGTKVGVSVNQNLLVNEIIMQLAPQQVMGKIMSRQEHIESVTSTVMDGQKP